MSAMTLPQALEFISRTDWKGSRLGLERMKRLLTLLGSPQEGLRFIHVAGTNGKGSTCAMLAAILTAAGYKTGRYTSPHLLRVNERMSIDGADVSDDVLCEMAARVSAAAAQMGEEPTEFEVLTAMALCWFRAEGCDAVALEVGLGGRLDATNVIAPPEAAVITNIGLEHTEILGDTLEKIAAEKAGIIKRGCTAVLYRGTPEVERVFETVCAERDVPLHKARFDLLTPRGQSVDGQSFDWNGLSDLRLALLGRHQLCNAAVALETVYALREKGWEISERAVRAGLRDVKWPGRLEVLRRNPLFLADGAHNPQCVDALADSLGDILHGEKAVFLLGVLADKDYPRMTAALLPHARGFICLTPDSPRALSAQALADFLTARGQVAVPCGSMAQGVDTALRLADGGAVVACGSLYMMGEVASMTTVLSDYEISKPFRRL